MFCDFIDNQYVIIILNEHKQQNCLRVARAVFSYGARTLYKQHFHIINNIKALEHIAFGSYKNIKASITEPKKSAMNSFFEELRLIKRILISLINK